MAETTVDRMARHDPKRVARAKYAGLLRHPADDDEAHAGELALAAHVLGRTPDQVRADAAVFAKLVGLEAVAKEEATAKHVAAVARRQLDEYETETARLAGVRSAERARLAGQLAAADDRAAEAANAPLAIEQLRNTNPALLG